MRPTIPWSLKCEADLPLKDASRFISTASNDLAATDTKNGAVTGYGVGILLISFLFGAGVGIFTLAAKNKGKCVAICMLI